MSPSVALGSNCRGRVANRTLREELIETSEGATGLRRRAGAAHTLFVLFRQLREVRAAREAARLSDPIDPSQ